jgi:hypothetical protein
MDFEIHRTTSEHDTPTLDRFNEVLTALRNETESGLMRMEFQNTAESLLGDHGKIVGVIEEYPCRCIRDGSDTADKLRQALANGGDAAIIGRRKAEGHRILMNGVCYSLILELFGDPGVREHRLADSRGTADDDVGRILDLGSQKGDGVFLAENGVHC